MRRDAPAPFLCASACLGLEFTDQNACLILSPDVSNTSPRNTQWNQLLQLFDKSRAKLPCAGVVVLAQLQRGFELDLFLVARDLLLADHGSCLCLWDFRDLSLSCGEVGESVPHYLFSMAAPYFWQLTYGTSKVHLWYIWYTFLQAQNRDCT